MEPRATLPLDTPPYPGSSWKFLEAGAKLGSRTGESSPAPQHPAHCPHSGRCLLIPGSCGAAVDSAPPHPISSPCSPGFSPDSEVAYASSVISPWLPHSTRSPGLSGFSFSPAAPWGPRPHSIITISSSQARAFPGIWGAPTASLALPQGPGPRSPSFPDSSGQTRTARRGAMPSSGRALGSRGQLRASRPRPVYPNHAHIPAHTQILALNPPRVPSAECRVPGPHTTGPAHAPILALRRPPARLPACSLPQPALQIE